MTKTRTICVIPARMAASRFPGKPMKKLLNLPMINHIYRRCKLFSGFERVIVATCDKEIFDSIHSEGGEAVMTSDSHQRCTDRVEEAIRNLKLDLSNDDFILMVQGDEILVSPEMLQNIVNVYLSKKPSVVNLISRLYSIDDHDDINTVKVVTDINDRVLYMSRAAIPSRARKAENIPMFQQTGIIGFSVQALHQFSSLEQTPAEKVESVDMLRFIENDLPVLAVRTDTETIGVDTPEDLARAETILKSDPRTKSYLS